MDSSSALRIAVRVPAYVETCDDGRNVAHSSSNVHLVRDRDTESEGVDRGCSTEIVSWKKSGLQSSNLRQAHQMLYHCNY
jgi:hypothetical protein